VKHCEAKDKKKDNDGKNAPEKKTCTDPRKQLDGKGIEDCIKACYSLRILDLLALL